MSDSIDKYIGNTMLNPMPKTAEITHNEWLLGKVPDSDLDTSYEQINVTFPYWQKHIKNDADLLTKVYKFPNRSAFIKELILQKKREYLSERK
tara:strand:- start:647 stop:925 length:279 start_codon:yes stop_codon:yes gene_type:complete